MNQGTPKPRDEYSHFLPKLSRRDFIRNGALATAALGLTPVLRSQTVADKLGSAVFGPAKWILPFDRDWQFGGRVDPVAGITNGEERKFIPVTLPHCVAKLSWENWDPATWEQVWSYRRQLTIPAEFRHSRIFVQF